MTPSEILANSLTNLSMAGRRSYQADPIDRIAAVWRTRTMAAQKTVLQRLSSG